MKRIMLLGIVAALVAVSQFALVGGCNYGQNADKIARALADRLGKNMSFEDGTTEQPADTLPPPNPDGAVAPQVSKILAPSVLRAGESFTVTLQTGFSAGVISGALLYINKASSFLQVNAVEVNGTMQISGRLNETDFIAGKVFNVRLAMATNGFTEVGEYVTWQIGIPRDDIDPEMELVCGEICRFVDRCGSSFYSSSDSQIGEYNAREAGFDVAECTRECAVNETYIRNNSSPQCDASLYAYIQCVLSLNCSEFENFVEAWGDLGPTLCGLSYEQMYVFCQDEDWWEDYGPSDPSGDADMDMDVDLDTDVDTDVDTETGPSQFCIPACVYLVACGIESDRSTCEETGCPFYGETALQCVASGEGDCPSVEACVGFGKK